MTILELKQGIFKENEVNADIIRKEMGESRKLLVNVMSSPGSGKTTTLVRTIEQLKGKFNIGVMECDIDSDVDALTIEKAGGKSVQLHTGGMCHMDAGMTRQGLDALDTSLLDIVFIENVGNLVCPAEFDTGSHLNVSILSVPEGDDKPAKYPLIYQVCDVVLINKIDALTVFDFDLEIAKERIYKCNKNAKIFCISAKNNDGIKEWTDFLSDYFNQRYF